MVLGRVDGWNLKQGDKKMFNSDHDRIVVMAGARYLGTAEGLVWFNPLGPDPSTLAIREDELSAEMVQLRLAENERTFSLGGSR
jgi:hypothetical protein